MTVTKPTAKPAHEQDIMHAAIAAKATEFVAFLFGGRGVRLRQEASSYAEAVDLGLRMKAQHPEVGPRRPLVYAIGPNRTSIEVDSTIARLAGFPEDAIERLAR